MARIKKTTCCLMGFGSSFALLLFSPSSLINLKFKLIKIPIVEYNLLILCPLGP